MLEVRLFEAPRQLLDVLRRPVRHFHAETQVHLCQHFLDLFERFVAEIRRAQHLGFGLLHQIADIDYVVVLQAVGRAYRQLKVINYLEHHGWEPERRQRAGLVKLPNAVKLIHEVFETTICVQREKQTRNFVPIKRKSDQIISIQNDFGIKTYFDAWLFN